METLYLLFPQWQGTGRGNEVYWGAKILGDYLTSYHFIEIPVSLDKKLQQKENILGYDFIKTQLLNATKIVSGYKPKQIFTIGGGCDTETVSVSYLNDLYKGNLLVIWIDAHGDLNTPESSPSKNFHGMPLRTLLGEGDPAIVELIKRPLKSSQICLVGTRDLDESEKQYVQTNNIRIGNVKNNLDTFITDINSIHLDNVYIHFDLDALDPKEFPFVKCPTPNGFEVRLFRDLIARVKNTKKLVGGSIVEYVPDKNNTGIDVAKNLFIALCQ